MRLKIHTDGFEGYAKRSLARAKKLSRGKKIRPEMSITFEDPLDMAEAITPERIRLCFAVRKEPLSVTALAAELGRDRRAVSRDVEILVKFGLINTRFETNPGHGRVRIVESVANRLELRVAI